MAPRVLTIVFAFAFVACGGPQKDQPHSHLSTSEHHTEARRHDKIAEGHEHAVKRNRERVAPGEMTCIDRPLAGVPSSGGERVPVARPCWTREMDPANIAHKREAKRHRNEARAHRAKARMLIEAEKRDCWGLGEDETSHSPFWHREDIASVTPIKRGKTIVGVKTVFKKVRGLSLQWMTRAVKCHKSRAAAAGYKMAYMTYCPLMLPDTKATVAESPAGLVVTITSPRSEMAAAALGRARHGHKGDHKTGKHH